MRLVKLMAACLLLSIRRLLGFEPDCIVCTVARTGLRYVELHDDGQYGICESCFELYGDEEDTWL